MSAFPEAHFIMLTTFNRRDDFGRIMNPPKGSAPALNKGIPFLVDAFDKHVLSENAKQQLVLLRIAPGDVLKMRTAFPPRREFEELLKRLPEQYESGGSDFAHWVVMNLASGACIKLRQREVTIPKWDKIDEALSSDPSHWFQYIMTLVVLHRYDYVRSVYFSSFTEKHIAVLKERYVRDLERQNSHLEYWSKRDDLEAAEEVKDLNEAIRILRDNIRNAKRITQG